MRGNYTKLWAIILMRINLNLLAFTIIFFTLPISNVYSYQNQNDIVFGTKNFIKQEIQTHHKTADLKTITIKILDNKTINNKICNKNINYFFPSHSTINQRATVVAECKDQNAWKVYIPVNIKFFANAISAKKSLPKSHIINKEDLTRKKINVLQLKDHYYTEPDDIIGLILKTSVKQNTVLTSRLLQEVNYES